MREHTLTAHLNQSCIEIFQIPESCSKFQTTEFIHDKS